MHQVTHVVCGDNDGHGTMKHTAALTKGVPTVDEQFILRLIKNAGAPAAAAKPAAASGATTAVAVASSSATAVADRDLDDGEEYEFPRQGGDPYVIKNIVSVPLAAVTVVDCGCR